MCNCSDLPEIVGDPLYNNIAITFVGISANPEYFQEAESDSWEPELEFGECNVRCKECGQYWYFECAPEESTFPLFGLKYRDHGYEPFQSEIEEKKEWLSILAHGGTQESECRIKGCKNLKLLGRELCVKHITFP